jgi:membrane-bound ClpP family serine protease
MTMPMDRIRDHHPSRWPGARTILKYALVQLPDIVIFAVVMLTLQRWLDLSPILVGVLIAIWILKDILMFPLLRRSFEENRPEDAHPMIGETGTARDRLDPTGYVVIHGELWQAELLEGHPPVEPGEPVRVEEARGLTLLVVLDARASSP